MEKRIIRIKLKEEIYRRYKVYCAINDVTTTEMTNRLIKKFVEESQQKIKIIADKDIHQL